MKQSIGLILAMMASFGASQLGAQSLSAEEELAKKLSNPIASLISVPFQFNSDSGYGADGNGSRTVVNFQPVVPISLTDNWNVISRTILPFIHESNITPGESTSGIGDVVQSFFFSPKEPTKGGLIWGVGPVFLLPTATKDLGADQFAAGVTGVVLKQAGPWTIGGLANHMWSVGSTSGGTKINATYIQPFVSYTTPEAWTFTANTESTYDWERDSWSIPVNFVITKLVKIAGKPVSIGGGVRYWAKSPNGGADGWGGRLLITFLFPK